MALSKIDVVISTLAAQQYTPRFYVERVKVKVDFIKCPSPLRLVIFSDRFFARDCDFLGGVHHNSETRSKRKYLWEIFVRHHSEIKFLTQFVTVQGCIHPGTD